MSESKKELPEIALSVRYSEAEKQYQLVTLRYDANTKKSEIASVENVGETKQMAIGAFKIAAVKNRFVT